MAVTTSTALSCSALDGPSEPVEPNLRASDPVPGSPSKTPHEPPNSFILPSLYRYVLSTDKSLVRLRRLLATTSGLDTFLATVKSGLDVLAHIMARPPPYPASSRVAGSSSRFSRNPSSHLPDPPADLSAVVSLKILARLLSETRMTLRLTSLLPLYTSLRQLLKNNHGQDRYLRAILLTQCLLYTIYQTAENIAFLVDRRVLSQRWLERSGGTAKLWILSNRAWLAGVSCDFLALFRKALIEKESRSSANKQLQVVRDETEEQFDRKWWRSIFVASCYLPMCLHYSLKEGLVGFNNGVLGMLGFLAGAQSFTNQWAEIEFS